MILGLGIDVCATARMREVLGRWGDRFSRRILRDEELTPLAQRADLATALAGRFAAKEAAAKAMDGAPGVGWHDLRVLGGGKRPPRLELLGPAQALAERVGVKRTHLSITHDGGVAAAVVVLEGEPTGASYR